METYQINNDIEVYCLTATSFPHGLPEIYGKLHAEYPPEDGRTYFGISYHDGKGSIVYKAAVHLNDTDSKPTDEYEQFAIKEGTYLSEVIHNYMDNTPAIGMLFQQMIKDSRIDPSGYCLEMYLSPTNVQCMVRLS
ncbi:MAG: hypothetical protein K9G49_09395 [Taibaiella sp.]|nr:hypothetical protein [Taibaiella sp.]